MRRRTALIAVVLLLVAALWGWRSGAVRVAGEAGPAAVAALEQTGGSVEASPAGVSVPESVAAPPVVPPPEIATAAPGFDVVRVEPDGSAVIAGRAQPGETVTLRSGTQELAQARAGAGGEFVLDLQLPSGEHRLQLSDARNALSVDAAVVSVPERARPDDLLVLMDRPGQPAEVLAGPPLAGRVQPEQETAAIAPQSAATAMAPAAPTLGVEAVEVENRRLSIAGAAPQGSRLKIYLDGQLVGEADGTTDQRFIANAMVDVSVGSHTVRIDEIARDGTVVARAEVPFTRPDDGAMAAVAPLGASPETARDGSMSGAAATGQTAPPVAEVAANGTAGPATVVQPALEAAQAKVIIRRGDSLWRVSRRAYGQGVRYTVIYLANGDQIRDPNRIYPGQVLRMPDDAGRPPRT